MLELNFAATRQRVVAMFHHAYDGYMQHAYPYDELRPLTCDGHDTWGSFSLTLIDALDTFAVMGNFSEFRRVADLVIEKMDFDIDINASVFETNIRILGGLLSAHLLSKRAEMELEPGWPCEGPLLRMADDVARRILPAFDTPTGMPYGTINLRHGVPKGETTVTCTAGVGTFIVEFGTLSRLTGDPVFEKVAMRALRALWDSKSELGLVGNHIDVSSGKWTALDSGIGGGIDSYFEYLVKGAIMFDIPEMLEHFKEYVVTIEKHTKRDDWYMWAHMTKGGITLPMFTSLDAYWPGIQSLLGDLDKGMKTMHNFHQVWKQFGFLPEYYNIPKNEAHSGREGYPLRPELLESAVYLYKATKDPFLLEVGIDAIEAIEHSAKTECGYATIKDVNTHRLDNRMESFFLAETTKYLYLLFDPDNFIHNNGSRATVIDTPNGECVIDAGGYFFNTEAHPIDMASVYCCSSHKKDDDRAIQNMHDNLDLLSLFGISEPEGWIKGKKLRKTAKMVESGTRVQSHVLQKIQQSDLLGKEQKDITSDIMFDVLKDRILELKAALEDKIQESNMSSNPLIGNISKNLDRLIRENVKDVKNTTTEDTEGSEKETIAKPNDQEEVSENIQKQSKPDLPEIGNSYKNVNKREISESEEVSISNQNTEEGHTKNNLEDEVGKDDKHDKEKTLDESNSNTETIKERKMEPSVQTVYIQPQTSEKEGKSQQKSSTDKNINQQTVSNIEKVFNLLLGNPEPKNDPLSSSPNILHLYRTMQLYPLSYIPRPEIMVCKAQPFHMRFSLGGELFDEE
ncbi:hypothetical protein FSP39_016082 [Pinctada imbricata]|uniref:alpha-1,2-Mannosidase n=1 Tax=Pinctada imbricata TaxID=66713 RepID=A0AA89C1Z3_PINIB|nr:hypothetical protein FSP39_016082 [Pinctada imbricata]